MGRRGPGARPTTVQRGATPREPHAPATPRPGAPGPAPALTRAEAVMAFCEGLTVTAGSLAGTPLRLRPWQRRFIQAVYATDEAGRRRVRTGVLSMGRKGGKSTFCAALAAAHLAGPEAVPRGQVVSAAADRQQAALIYNELKAFVLADPGLTARIVFRDHNKSAEDDVTGSTFLALSREARSAHGGSPVVAICDELAQWRGRELLDAIRTGQGAHAEPLLLAISTRSPIEENPFEEILRYAATGDDPTCYAEVFSAPLTADPWDEKTWRLANPDATPERMADIAAQAEQAKRLPSTEPAFRAYCLNQPVSALDDRWISPADFDACRGEAELRGPIYAGLDLGSGSADLSAVALYSPETGALRVWGFLPRQQVDTRTRVDAAPYPTWIAQGVMVALPGRTLDRSALLTWIAHQTASLDLRGLSSDRWLLDALKADAEREGIDLPWMPHGAGFKDMSPALQVFEREVIEGRLRHGGNGLLRWAVSNMAIDHDAAGNRKPAKQRAVGRIDPAVAAILAVSAAERGVTAPTFEFTGLLV